MPDNVHSVTASAQLTGYLRAAVVGDDVRLSAIHLGPPRRCSRRVNGGGSDVCAFGLRSCFLATIRYPLLSVHACQRSAGIGYARRCGRARGGGIHDAYSLAVGARLRVDSRACRGRCSGALGVADGAWWGWVREEW